MLAAIAAGVPSAPASWAGEPGGPRRALFEQVQIGRQQVIPAAAEPVAPLPEPLNLSTLLQRAGQSEPPNTTDAAHLILQPEVLQAPQGGTDARSSAESQPDGQTPRTPRFDPALVQRGESAFQESCTACHDAARSLEKTKSLAQWRGTVERMAAKDGADVASGDVEAIAVYLASQDAPAEGENGEAAADAAPADAGSQVSLFATLAPMWRGAERDDDLENRGFFPDVWAGAEWRPSGPISGRVTACVTCHRGTEQGGHIELAEGVIRFDLEQLFHCRTRGPRTTIEAGRFIVPFGAIAAKSHPGALRTVTRPLMFNMGQNVNRTDIGPPILPMPYADEGVALKRTIDFNDEVSATFDVYLVNGLQGGTTGVNFFQSRDYTDNNADPAVGGRITIGNKYIRLGTSAMGGKFNADGTVPPLDETLNYDIFGADITARYEDVLRFQAEYALRTSDRLLSLPGQLRDDEEYDGFSVETELRIHKDPRVGLVLRYDTLDRQGDLPPPGSSLGPRFSLYRVTWGFNVTLPGGSMLLLNHEHWSMPSGLRDVEVAAVRWVATF